MFLIEIGARGVLYALVTCVVFLIIYNLFSKSSLNRNALFGALTVLCFLSLSLIWSRAPNYGTTKVIMLSAWMLMAVNTRKEVRDNLHLFVQWTILAAAVYLVVFWWFNGSPLGLIRDSSVYSRVSRGWGLTQSNPVYVARYLGFIVIISISHLFFSPQENKVHWSFKLLVVPVATLSILYLLVTNSRGPIVAGVIAITLLLLFQFSSKRKGLNRVFAFGIAFVVTIVVWYVLQVVDYQLIQSRFVLDESAYSRVDHINLAFQNLSGRSLLIGNGTGDYGFLFVGSDARAYPHNIFVEILYENGIAAALSFMVVLIILVVSALTSRSDASILFSILVIYFLVNAQFSGDLISNNYLFVFAIFAIPQYSTRRRVRASHSDQL